MAQRNDEAEDLEAERLLKGVKSDLPDYPNWRKGIFWGLACAIPAFAAAYLSVPASKFQIAGIFAILIYLGAGGLLAFKPPK